MKLSGQASQSWINFKNKRAVRDRPSIDTWDRMKEELPPSFNARLMDNWHQYTKATNLPRSISRISMIPHQMQYHHKEGEVQILSRFRSDLRDDLRIKLLAREVNELETSYALVQDLDFVRTNHTFKSLVPVLFHIGMTSRTRVLNGRTKTKAPSFSKLVP